MRLDKYLKVSMLIKRRVIAKELADAEKVSVNGKVAKPNCEIKVGDTLVITLPSKVLKVEVTSINDKDFFKNPMYQLINE
jgi:ribosomal 50S subunit-recycling heat shock protein